MSFDSSRSGGKSKRSLGSNSTNTSDKKRKPNQKTLGMAWGSNSLSSSKSKSNSLSSPFTDFGSYMAVKNRKLHDQFEVAAASSSSLGDSNSNNKPLFYGVAIFVDGFTVPSNQELRGYMLKYGGRFENYFSRHRVTHIICSNLPDSKIKNLRSFSGGLPVVKPIWVLDCVAANKLLNWVPYQLDQLVNNTIKQPKLSTFFSIKSSSVSDNVEIPVNYHVQSEIEESLLRPTAFEKQPSYEGGESFEYVADCSPEVSTVEPCEVIKEKSTSADEKFSELKTEQEDYTDKRDEKSVPENLKYSPCKSSASANDFLGDQNLYRSCNPRSAVTSTPTKCHSTLGDPNFVENYFKKSRLHFIGTWRNRYRKRFPSSPAEAKCGNSTVNAPTGCTAIIHIDMDCFFVSVVIRDHPELHDKPVAVCHSDSPRGTAEISSANYPARDSGVRAGMFVRDAKALCPRLVIVPYNFEAYEEVADQFYNILHKHSNKVQALSCDEAFLDVIEREDENPEHIASTIRQEIVETTRCTASAGVAGNLLIARLATRAAKPNGQRCISPEMVESFLDDLPIKALPGIGHVLEEKLKKLHIQTCGQLRMISKESLQKDFGSKTGDMLWNFSRGIDKRHVGEVQETKSVGADVNWGVRFNDLKDSQHFLTSLCNEVSLRLQGCGALGRTFTLKVKKRRNNAGEPTKYMGCGDCENLSHSITIPMATDDVEVLQRISKQLLSYFCFDVKEIRGIGLQVSKLESSDIARQGHEKKSLKSWLASAPVNTKESIYPSIERVVKGAQLLDGQINATVTNQNKQGSDRNFVKLSSNSAASCQMHINKPSGETSSQASAIPPISDLDIAVIESLPPEIFSEVNEMYGGKLADFINKKKVEEERISSFKCPSSVEEFEGIQRKGKEPYSHCVLLGRTTVENKSMLQELPSSAAASGAGASDLCLSGVEKDHIDLMPASLSQVDISVLQQLPEEMKADILDLLPAHRKPELSSDCPMEPAKESHHKASKNLTDTQMDEHFCVSRTHLWVGNPPEWVDKFEVSNHLILNLLAELYHKSGYMCRLSSILQSAVSLLPLFVDTCGDGDDIVVTRLCELLHQYIEIHIKQDMEEIYICFRFLKRFSQRSSLFFRVYDGVLPYLQATFTENYGGSLNI